MAMMLDALRREPAVNAPASIRTDCPVCRRRRLLPSVTVDDLPVLCNMLAPDAESARAIPLGQLALAFCRDCAHLFNAAFEEHRVGYGEDYENSLHFSSRFEAFAAELASRLDVRYGLAGKTVAEIGCGKGDFLKRLCAMSGAMGIGFDKSFEHGRGADVPGVHFVNGWFDDTANVQADLIVCRQVLEHVAEPVAFLRAIAANPGVRPDTVLYLDVPNALYTLRDLGIWDLIYEHASYFTPASLEATLHAAGFEVLAIGTCFGEQYLYAEVRLARAQQRPVAADVRETEELVRAFAGAHGQKLRRWNRYLSARKPERLVVWGAGSKGTIFVNVLRDGRGVRALVDVNPHKQGCFIPRTATPVLAPEALRGEPVEAIVVMNPLYSEEIAQTARELGLIAEIVLA